MASEEGDGILLKLLIGSVVVFFFTMFQTLDEYDYWTKSVTADAQVTDIREYRSRRSSGYEVFYSYLLDNKAWTGSFKISRESLPEFQNLKQFRVQAIPGPKIPRSRILGDNNTGSVIVFCISLSAILAFLIKMQFFNKKEPPAARR